MTTDKIDVLDAVAELIAERDSLRKLLALRLRLQKLPASDSLAAARIAVIALAGAAKSDAAFESAYQAVSAAIAKATGASA